MLSCFQLKPWLGWFHYKTPCFFWANHMVGRFSFIIPETAYFGGVWAVLFEWNPVDFVLRNYIANYIEFSWLQTILADPNLNIVPGHPKSSRTPGSVGVILEPLKTP